MRIINSIVPGTVALLLSAGSASAQVPSVMTYQGRLQVGGTNFSGSGEFKFALVSPGTNTSRQAMATATVTSGFITGIMVVDGGAGYTAPPVVAIADPTGSGAVAVAQISGGTVTNVMVQTTGASYSSPTVAIAPPPPSFIYATFWSNDATSSAGSQPAGAVNVPVQQGLFTVFLGDTNLPNMQPVPVSVFTQPDVHLRIWFNDGVNGFVQLTPDQRLGSVGYADVAALAAQVLPGAVSATALADQAVTTAKLAANAVTSAQIQNGTIVAANLSPVLLNGTFWTLSGNSGTAPGTNFLGTTDNQPIEVWVNGARAFRLEPNATSPNVIGGYMSNSISPGVYGATIAGGGRFDPVSGDLAHHITAPHGAIGGGDRNSVNGQDGTVAGGGGNVAGGDYSSVGGGLFNTVADFGSTIGGGYDNLISSNTYYANISGGWQNIIQTNNYSPTISGGFQNVIQSSSDDSHIGGGRNNVIAGAFRSVISGGMSNQIALNAYYSAVGGGYDNSIQANARYSTIGGGGVNAIQANAQSATIGGGAYNSIETNTTYSTIGGGAGNGIQANAQFATIGGGNGNAIETNTSYSTIGGGYVNTIRADAATIAGGYLNTVGAAAQYATIGGGYNNIGSGNYATVPGGADNLAQGQLSFAAGYQAQALHPGAFVWADSAGAVFSSQRTDQFRVRANGGVRLDLNTTNWVEFYGQNLGRPPFTFPAVINTSTGAYLSSGGSWVNSSDRNLKENFQVVDREGLLDKVAALPITRWNYKVEGSSAEHIGPVAQDFYAAFHVGGDDKHIATVDESGVALAAIQGLNQKVEDDRKQLSDELRAKDAQIRSLGQRLDRLERLLSQKDTR